MEIYSTLDKIKHRPAVVLAIGSFDGLHQGHRKILDKVREEAKRLGVKSMIITFSPTPREVFSGLKEIALMKPEEKIDAIRAMGIDLVCMKHFDLEFAKISPDDFLKRLLTYLDLKAVVAGPDHSIGKKEEGGIEYLRKAGEIFGFDLFVVPKTEYKGQEISSQLIRKTLKTGRIDDVDAMLGYSYRICGTVVPGMKRGRTLGYPTLNIKPDLVSCMIPAYGVYCVSVRLDGKDMPAICNIGVRPTFNEEGLSMEVYVFDVDLEHQYGKAVEIRFMHYIRKERKFENKEALIEQIEKDIERCKTY
ncbi:MAG: bifunctional riboflavin kinase/FAD synthetase [Candidatus Marinimicrobia bacterium]|nr:bifunctional riboflavin kinase/FAD synthetase [Candidatus Neomarinimicrobiota bacterium]